MAQSEETAPAQPKAYFEIPLAVDDDPPESSATHHHPPPPTHTSHKPLNGPWFTFDDIPSSKCRERLQEMSAWIDLKMIQADATTESVLREFTTRFTGSLRDWFDSLGQ